MAKHRKIKRRAKFASLDASPSVACGTSLGYGSSRSSRQLMETEYGFVFRPNQELLPDNIASAFIPYEEDVHYDPVTGTPIVRKAKLDMTDYELRYLDFLCMQLENHGVDIIDEVPDLWRKKERKRSFDWMAKSPDDRNKLFMWTPLKIEAADLLARGHKPIEVGKRIGRMSVEVKSWLTVDAFRMEVSRRKLEFTEEHLENRKRELREMLDTIGVRAQRALELLDAKDRKLNYQALSQLRVLLEEYRQFRDQERKDHGEATQIIANTFETLNENRYTVEAIVRVIKTPEEREIFLKDANAIAEEIAESLAVAQAKNVTPPKQLTNLGSSDVNTGGQADG